MQFRSFFFAVTVLVSGSLFADVTEEEKFTFNLDDGGRLARPSLSAQSRQLAGGQARPAPRAPHYHHAP